MRVARIHIHHSYGLEEYLERLVKALDLPFDFTAHDYYTLSWSPNLCDETSVFVGEDLKAASHRLQPLARKTPHSLKVWQDEHQWLLTKADRVIVPTTDVARRLRAHVPEVRPRVAAHPETIVPAPTIVRRHFSAEATLRIATLGELSVHKGYRVVADCLRLIRDLDLPLSITVIGEVPSPAELTNLGGMVTGRYQSANAVEVVNRQKVDLLWYPAQWPETYSYTLSEGLSAGLPLVVPNIGAFPERVGGRPWTWVCPWNWRPQDWIAFFVAIRNGNFLRNQEPPVEGDPWPVNADFYRGEYLAWADVPSAAYPTGGASADLVAAD